MLAGRVQEAARATDSGGPEATAPASDAGLGDGRKGGGDIVVQLHAHQPVVGLVWADAGGPPCIGTIGVSVGHWGPGATRTASHGAGGLHGRQLVDGQHGQVYDRQGVYRDYSVAVLRCSAHDLTFHRFGRGGRGARLEEARHTGGRRQAADVVCVANRRGCRSADLGGGVGKRARWGSAGQPWSGPRSEEARAPMSSPRAARKCASATTSRRSHSP